VEACDSEEEVRPVWRPWTRTELLARREREGAACWAEGDELIFVCQADADQVRLTGGLQSEMWRVEGDLWVVGYRVRRLDQAFVSYAFVPDGDFAAAFAGGMAVWRGPAAPEPPASADELQGELRHLQVPSQHLPAARAVHAYLSPGWHESPRTLVVQAADGAHRAHVLEPLVLQAGCRPSSVSALSSSVATTAVPRSTCPGGTRQGSTPTWPSSPTSSRPGPPTSSGCRRPGSAGW